MRKKQVAVIGSGTVNKKSDSFTLAIKLGQHLIDSDYRILCGGLEGIMAAVCKGAKLSDNYKEGMTVGIIPSLDKSISNPYVDISIATGVSFARNQIIIASADAVIAIGGGAGTLSELSFAWQLKKPILAFINAEGWSNKLAGKRIDNSQTDVIIACQSVEAAITHLSRIFNNIQ